MEIKATNKLEKEKFNIVIIATDKEKIGEIALNYPEVKDYLETECFDGKDASELSLVMPVKGKKLSYKLLAIDEDTTNEELMETFGRVAKEISSEKAEKLLLDVSLLKACEDKEKTIAILKGLAHGSYVFNKYISDKKALEAKIIEIYSDGKIDNNTMELAKEINESIRLAKVMVDEPANVMTPKEIARQAKESLEKSNVEVEIYESKEIEELGMNLFMNVAKGADNKPRLIVMRYLGNPESEEKIALIGKGLAYDTGGYSLKSSNYMKDMRSDMGGAAAVIAAMKLISAEKIKANVIAVVATCENRISGSSYLPGDILKSMNGKTVEIDNTDAEGRLTLADAMTYAIRKEGASKLVDICTLTGACLAALGEEYAGVVTKEDELWKKIEEASLKSLDPCWRLPLNKRIIGKNKSKLADLKNSGGQPGCETAAAFVGEFSEGLPWIHIDVAGTAFIEESKEHMRAGGTGFGVHLLSELVKIL